MSTTSMEYRIYRLSGRLANGFEADKGPRWHAVVSRDKGPTALCGAFPGRKSVGWLPEDGSQGESVTCPRCLSKLEVAS